jgi:predicted component of type VI protein secretion system
MPRPLSCLLLAVCFTMLVSPLAAQTIYQWKDARGVTHYSDSPPPKGGTRREVRTSEAKPATPSTVAASSKAPNPEAAPPEAAPPATPQVVADPAKCAMAQHNLASLQSNAAVGMDTDNDGYTDAEIGAAERARYVGLAQEAIKSNCPGGG